MVHCRARSPENRQCSCGILRISQDCRRYLFAQAKNSRCEKRGEMQLRRVSRALRNRGDPLQVQCSLPARRAFLRMRIARLPRFFLSWLCPGGISGAAYREVLRLGARAVLLALARTDPRFVGFNLLMSETGTPRCTISTCTCGSSKRCGSIIRARISRFMQGELAMG